MKKISILVAYAMFFLGAVSQAALTPLGGEYPLLGDIAGHQQNPHVAVGITGGFVAWQNATDNSKGERILAQRLNADFSGMRSIHAFPCSLKAGPLLCGKRGRVYRRISMCAFWIRREIFWVAHNGRTRM